MKIYIGIPDEYTVKVIEFGTNEPTVRKINHRLDLENHSPTGLAWGYGGSGPAQCALAILADFLGDSQDVLLFYQLFKARVIGELNPNAPFALGDWTVSEHVEMLRLERRNKAREEFAKEQRKGKT